MSMLLHENNSEHLKLLLSLYNKSDIEKMKDIVRLVNKLLMQYRIDPALVAHDVLEFSKSMTINDLTKLADKDLVKYSLALERIGDYYANDKSYKNSHDAYLGSVNIANHVYKKPHKFTADLYLKMSNLCISANMHNDALMHSETALKFARSVYAGHDSELKLLGFLQSTTQLSYYNGKYEKAILLAEEVFNILYKLRENKESSEFADLYFLWFSSLDKLGKDSEALEVAQKFLSIKSKLLTSPHTELEQTLHDVAYLLCKTGMIHEAIEKQEQALKMQLELYADNHPSIAKTYHNLFVFHYLLGNIEQAKEFSKKSIEIYDKLGPEYVSTIASKSFEIASLLKKIAQFEEAIEYYNKVLMISEKYGNKHYMAEAYTHMAKTYSYLKNYEDSIKFYTKSNVIISKLYGEGHILFSENILHILNLPILKEKGTLPELILRTIEKMDVSDIIDMPEIILVKSDNKIDLNLNISASKKNIMNISASEARENILYLNLITSYFNMNQEQRIECIIETIKESLLDERIDVSLVAEDILGFVRSISTNKLKTLDSNLLIMYSSALREVGDYFYRENHYQDSYDIYNKIIGFVEPKTAKIKVFIAEIYLKVAQLLSDVNQHREALFYSVEATHMASEVYTNHYNPYDYIKFIKNLAEEYHFNKDFNNSFKAYSDVIKLQDILKKEVAPLDSANTYSDLADLLLDFDKFDDSLIYREKSLAMKYEIFGHVNENIIYELIPIISLFTVLGRYEDAIVKSIEVLEIETKLYGDKYIGVANSYRDLCRFYHFLKKHELALDACKKTLALYEELQIYHDEIALNIEVGSILEELGRKEEAFALYQEILAKSISEDNIIDMNAIYQHMAKSYSNLGQHHLSLSFYKKSLELAEKIYGEKDVYVAHQAYFLAEQEEIIYELSTHYSFADINQNNDEVNLSGANADIC